MMKEAFLAVLFFAPTVGAPVDAAGQASAVGFKRLQSLAGEWLGKDEHGGVAKSSFRIVVSNTTVMETLTAAGMEEMITLYTRDGDGIALVHYCPTNNQPRMRATPPSATAKELVFSFQGATNLPDPSIGHEQKLILQFTGADQIVEHWTWRKNGKDTEMIYNFSRGHTG